MLQPYQQRVVDEKAELEEKIAKLKQFLRGDGFTALPTDEKWRLNLQFDLMLGYADILGERIEAFKHATHEIR